MKRFRFPLRPVAVLRAHRELQAQEVFGAAVRKYVAAEKELTDTRARVVKYEAELSAGRRERFSAADEARALAMYRYECNAEVQVEKAMIAARDTMNQRRNDYLEAHRKVEVVKRLEQDARTEHRTVTMREEQAEFDDFASRRATRRSLFPA